MQSQEGVTLAAAQHSQYFKMRYQRSNGQLEQLNMCIAGDLRSRTTAGSHTNGCLVESSDSILVHLLHIKSSLNFSLQI